MIELYAFKVKDYTTILFGQKRMENCDGHCTPFAYYYVERGDGVRYEYDQDRIEWVQFLGIYEQIDFSDSKGNKTRRLIRQERLRGDCSPRNAYGQHGGQK